MELKYGLISCDSHAQVDKDAFTSRMSGTKWGDRIPQIVEINDAGSHSSVERWTINGKILRERGVCNCPAVMNNSDAKCYPQRWEEVPRRVYDPVERLKALDEDRVDAEVLFPNDPGNCSFFQFIEEAEFELGCVQAYNDALAEWREVSARYIPLAVLPYLSPIGTIVGEVERSVRNGHRGIIMSGEPSTLCKGSRHFNDPYWYPLWATCQDLGIPVHFHAAGGLSKKLSIPRWSGFTEAQLHSIGAVRSGAFPTQLIPNLILSGVMDRFPRLKWVSAETGLGWASYVLEACDYEWERHHLWTEGAFTRPSDAFRRQIYVNFWFEKAGVHLRHHIGVDNIMWESDYPHTPSTYPESWKYVEQTLEDVPQEERRKLLYENAVHVYKLS